MMLGMPTKYVIDLLILGSQVTMMIIALRIRVAVAEIKTLMYKEFVTKRDLALQHSMKQELGL